MFGQFGAGFKKIRNNKNYSQSLLTDDTISKASISRFENGKQDLGIEKTNSLLEKMSSSMDELLCEFNSQNSRADSIYVTVNQAYLATDSKQLKKLFEQQEHVYSERPSLQTFLNKCLIANFYADLTNDILVTKNDLQRLYGLLLNYSDWTSAEIATFTNSSVLLTDYENFTIACELAKQIETIQKTNYPNYIDCWAAILNAFLILIERNVLYAQQLRKIICEIVLPSNSINVSLRRYFLISLLDAKTSDTSSSSFQNDAKTIINLLRRIGNEAQADSYEIAYNDILSAESL